MERKYWNPELETLPAADQRRLGHQRLLTQLDYVAANSEMYRRKWAEAGVLPGIVKGARNLAGMPFTTKTELRASQRS